MAEAIRTTLMRVEAIADILGIPVEQFKCRSIQGDVVATDECLRLWSLLKTAKGRQQALEALRLAVDDETD